MSQIAALLLMFMNEEDAFWALAQLLTNQKHGMHGETRSACVRPVSHLALKGDSALSLSGFFVPGFPKLQRFQAHHDQIISKLIPKLKKHLVRPQSEQQLAVSSPGG